MAVLKHTVCKYVKVRRHLALYCKGTYHENGKIDPTSFRERQATALWSLIHTGER
jgi:hypothetical protein